MFSIFVVISKNVFTFALTSCGQSWWITEYLINVSYQRLPGLIDRGLVRYHHGILLNPTPRELYPIPPSDRLAPSVKATLPWSTLVVRRLPEPITSIPSKKTDVWTQSRNTGDQDEPFRVSTVITTLDLLILLLEYKETVQLSFCLIVYSLWHIDSHSLGLRNT